MSYSTLTIPQLTLKLTALKDLASDHQKLIHYYIVLPTHIAITDGDLFELASNLSPTTTNFSAQPPTFSVHDVADLLSRAKAQATELRTWADYSLKNVSYHPLENRTNPAFLGPYVNSKERELLLWVRKNLEDMVVLFEKVRFHDAVALKAKPQIKMYLQGTLTDVLRLVPVLLQFGEDA
jgi:hypothetical protein